jgi:hypothetical protein
MAESTLPNGGDEEEILLGISSIDTSQRHTVVIFDNGAWACSCDEGYVNESKMIPTPNLRAAE